MSQEKSHEFDWKRADLSQSALIEASAGTGKTYTLEHIVGRLICSDNYGLRMKQILVVTFTNKAVAELKERIRRELLRRWEARDDQSEGGDQSEGEGFLSEEGRQRLKESLESYDQAPVYTIHGFCQSLLKSCALENGGLVSSRFQKDDGGLLREAVWEILRWMEGSGQEEPLFPLLQRALETTGSFETLADLMTGWAEGWSEGDVVKTLSLEEYREIQASLERSFLSLVKSLPSREEWMTGAVSPQTREAGRKMASDIWDVFSQGREELERDGSLSLSDLPLSPKDLTFLINRKDTDRPGPFWSAFREWAQLQDSWQGSSSQGSLDRWAVNQLGLEILPRVQERAAFKRKQQGLLVLSDLITQVYQRVHDPRGRRILKEAVSRDYNLVLLDEFQDTDYRQWEIFHSLFDWKILVGDPKQSIYRFRQADLEIYFTAKALIGEERHYSLQNNYRSLPSLVEGVNILFSSLFSQELHQGGGSYVPWQPSRGAAPPEKAQPLAGSGDGGEPFVFLPFGGEEQFLLAADLEREMVEAYAREIEGLLAAGLCRPREIGVLVKKHNQGDAMKEALLRRGINGTLSRSESIYQSPEARDWEILLTALAEPRNRGLRRTALLSGWFGLSPEELRLVEEAGDDGGGAAPGGGEVLLAFAEWAQRINEGHLLEAFDQISEGGGLLLAAGLEKGVSAERAEELRLSREERDLAAPGGERVYTNRFHVLDILRDFQERRGGGCAEMARELGRRRRETQKVDEDLQRLERDDEAVQIMTLHACKGLEFKVVFFAGGLDTGGIEKAANLQGGGTYRGVRYINDQRQTVRDFRETEESRHRASLDAWEEAKRLFYVGITRGVSRVYLPFPRRPKSTLRLHSFYAGLLWGDVKERVVQEFKKPLAGLPLDLMPKSKIAGRKTNPSQFTSRFIRILKDAVEALCRRHPEIFRWGSRLEDAPETPAVTAHQETSAGPEPLLEGGRELGRRYPRMTSFSSLSRLHGAGPLEEIEGQRSREEDEGLPREPSGEELAEEAQETEDTLLSLAPGAAFGNALHQLLEEADWDLAGEAEDPRDLEKNEAFMKTLEETFRREFSREWIRSHGREIIQMVWEVLGTPLPEEKGLPLYQAARERLAEMEFILRLEDPGRLSWGGFSGETEPGFLKGYIDLVFRHQGKIFIADWKTTRPSSAGGPRLADYGSSRLDEVMEEHQYKGQALIYTAALVREMKRRDPSFSYERDFGGIYYFFVRGMRRDQGAAGRGIFFWKPREEEFQAFCRPWLTMSAPEEVPS